MFTASTDPEVGKLIKLAHKAFDGTNSSAAALLSDGTTVVAPSVRGHSSRSVLNDLTTMHHLATGQTTTREIVVHLRPVADAPGFEVTAYGSKAPEKTLV